MQNFDNNPYDNRFNNNNNNNFSNGYYGQNQIEPQMSPRLALKQAHPSPSIYVPLHEQAPVQAHRLEI